MHYKIVLVGDSCVGKTSIVDSFFGRNMSKYDTGRCDSTIGVCFSCIEVDGIKMHVWDTAGQERYKSIVRLYFRNTHLFIIVFDLNDKKSFDNLKSWVDVINVEYTYDNYSYHDNCETIKFILVGNKCDLDQDVTENEINDFVKENKIDFYISTSAKE